MMRRFTLLTFSAFLAACVAGCGGGGTAPAAAGTAGFTVSSLTFASTAIGSSAGAQTLTFANSTSASITITSVVLSDTNPADFSETNTCVGTLAAGASCTVAVNFTPTAIGSPTATVAAVDTAAGSPQIATLTGTATAAPAALADLEPQNGITFGTTVVANAATSQTATLTNTGAAALTITGIAFTGTNASDFSQNNTCGSSLAINATCTITVNFTPGAIGARSATLTATDNSGNGTTQSIAVTGTGALSSAPVASLAPTSLSFTSGTAQIVTLSNTGAGAMTISGITITGANPTNFAQTNTCGSSLNGSSSCTISVTFAPSGSGSYGATLNVADNAAGSPQTVALSGTAAPVASFSVSSLNFTESTTNTTTAAQTVTLTNTGTASMTGIAVSLAGATPGSFAQTNNCSTLAVNASCNINVTFTPAANGTVNATVSVADNAAGSPQTVTLNGYGPGSITLSQTLVTEGLNGDFSSIYNLINSATSTIDMTMYELTDLTATNDLIAAKNRGVTVRVILDESEKSNNATDYAKLVAAGIPTVYSNTHFVNTHQKSIEVDSAIPSKAQVAIMTANLSAQYYSTSRDFLLFENDPNDIAAIEATFQEDFTYSYGTTYPSFTPSFGDDLVWSYDSGTSTAATTPRQLLIGVIQSAKHTLILDEEEMSDSGITAALTAAANNGVSVKMSISAGEYTASLLNTMQAAGVGIVVYPSSGPDLYIHAKVIIADQGTATEQAFLGSENISSNSLDNNRELGLIMTDSTSPQAQSIIQSLNTTLTSDFSCPAGSGCVVY